jgi:SAM-dependent methyltransferase
VTAAPPRIFDPIARRLRRDRYARQGSDELERHIATLLAERLEALDVAATSALVVNTGFGHTAAVATRFASRCRETDHGPEFARRRGALLTDEDALSFGSGAFDLVVVPAGLDTVNDLPGALIAARRTLRPGGTFLAVMLGAPTLPTLRSILAEVDADGSRAVQRIHPQVDVRGAGDLLSRAGFTAPVADIESQSLAYASLERLRADMRQVGAGNVLAQRHALNRNIFARATAAFASRTGRDGRCIETVTLLTMTARAP